MASRSSTSRGSLVTRASMLGCFLAGCSASAGQSLGGPAAEPGAVAAADARSSPPPRVVASPAAAAAATNTAPGATTVPSPTEGSSAGSSAVSAAVPPPPTPRVDVVSWATPEPVVEAMLSLAEVRSSDLVYDLGCGDARLLVAAAQRLGARGFGVDIDPRRVVEARRNVREAGVEDRVRVERADIFTLDLSQADVVFLCLLTRLNDRLVPQLEQLKPGARIVSHEFDIPRAKPRRVLRVAGPPDGPPETAANAARMMHTLYLWRMPWPRRVPPTEPNQPCWTDAVAAPGSPCAVPED